MEYPNKHGDDLQSNRAPYQMLSNRAGSIDATELCYRVSTESVAYKSR